MADSPLERSNSTWGSLYKQWVCSTKGTSQRQIGVVKYRCIQGPRRIAHKDTVVHRPTPLNCMCLSSAVVLFPTQHLVLYLILYVAEQSTLLASS